MPDSEEGAAIRRLVYTIAENPSDDAQFLDVVHEALDDYERLRDEHEELRDKLSSIETQLNTIQDLGSKRTTKEEKIARLVTYAQNTIGEDATTGRVLLSIKEIRGNADVSERYAYKLVDRLPEEYEFFIDRSDVKQYGDAEMDRDDQQRGLVVDIGVLHQDEQALNKFNNATTGDGVSA